MEENINDYPAINNGTTDLTADDVIKEGFSIDYYNPEMLAEVQLQKYTKIPLTEISALGSAFSAMVPVFAGTTTDLYMVASKGSLVHAKGIPGGYRGFVRGKSRIESQAVLRKAGTAGANIPMLFMSVAIMGIQKEMKELEKMHTELIEIVERDKKSQLAADMEILSEYADNYKYYWDNETVLTVNLNQVKNIKRNARKDMISYEDEIRKILEGKLNTILNHAASMKVGKLSDQFARYRLALYVYSFATYMEVMLSKDFDEDYLSDASGMIKRFFDEYREIYTNCYNEIDYSINNALNTQVVSGYATVNKFIGKQLGKVDFLNKKEVDKALIANGESIEDKEEERLQNVMDKFITYKDSGTDIFYKNINVIRHLFNDPVELFWDNENVYIDMQE